MLHPTWSRDTFLSKRTGQVCLQTNWKNISTFQQPSLFFIACWTSTTFFKKSGIRAFFLVDVCGVQIFLGHQTWLTPRVGIELTRSYKPHLWGICNCCRGTKFRWEKRYLGKKTQCLRHHQPHDHCPHSSSIIYHVCSSLKVVVILVCLHPHAAVVSPSACKT